MDFTCELVKLVTSLPQTLDQEQIRGQEKLLKESDWIFEEQRKCQAKKCQKMVLGVEEGHFSLRK